MIFHPSILALYLASILTSLMVSFAAFYGVQILRRWDLRSGSEVQLTLERKTYLISTLLTYVFGFQLISLFLYIFTADRLHTLFAGAMCAAGTLNVNGFGYPSLILKMIIFLVAGLWLILNHADNRAYDYPLIKEKYIFLLIAAPLVLAETVLQAGYFIKLQPNIITSCCGSLFSTGENGFTSDIASLPPVPMMFLFYLSIGLTMISGFYFYRKGKGGYWFTGMNGIVFILSLASIISFISIYYYELPTHHCPFCLLQEEYGYMGYPLYLSLFGSTVAGIGVGLLMPFRKIESLSAILPSIQRKLAITALICLLLVVGLVTFWIAFSNLTLQG